MVSQGRSSTTPGPQPGWPGGIENALFSAGLPPTCGTNTQLCVTFTAPGGRELHLPCTCDEHAEILLACITGLHAPRDARIQIRDVVCGPWRDHTPPDTPHRRPALHGHLNYPPGLWCTTCARTCGPHQPCPCCPRHRANPPCPSRGPQ